MLRHSLSSYVVVTALVFTGLGPDLDAAVARADPPSVVVQMETIYIPSPCAANPGLLGRAGVWGACEHEFEVR